MRITEGQLRRIIREALLAEGAMTPEQADRKGITFKVRVYDSMISIAAIRDGDEEDRVGLLRAEATREPCLGAWSVTRSRVSPEFDGLGPLLYDLMIDLVQSERGAPLTPDRASVSLAAKGVWDHYMSRRDDIESEPLDNPEDELTPGVEDDNCGQNSAIMWSGEGQPWHGLSIARAYRRRGGGTPVLDALDDLGIIEIE